jgi:hypothetical protein
MANKQIVTVHMQSKQFADGVPIYPKPIYIIDSDEEESSRSHWAKRQRL